MRNRQSKAQNARKQTRALSKRYLQAINNGIHLNTFCMIAGLLLENKKIIISHGKDFIMLIKANRKIAISEADRDMGNFVGIDSLKPGGDKLSG